MSRMCLFDYPATHSTSRRPSIGRYLSIWLTVNTVLGMMTCVCVWRRKQEDAEQPSNEGQFKCLYHSYRHATESLDKIQMIFINVIYWFILSNFRPTDHYDSGRIQMRLRNMQWNGIQSTTICTSSLMLLTVGVLFSMDGFSLRVGDVALTLSEYSSKFFLVAEPELWPSAWEPEGSIRVFTTLRSKILWFQDNYSKTKHPSFNQFASLWLLAQHQAGTIVIIWDNSIVTTTICEGVLEKHRLEWLSAAPTSLPCLKYLEEFA